MKQFEKVQVKRPNLSTHDLSHEVKLTGNMGKLIPILMEETLPGDKFQLKSELLMRFMPTIAPIMQRINAYVHYFFVPNRIIWDEWEDFITGGREGSLLPNLPKIVDDPYDYKQSSRWQVNSLADYFGIPVQQFEHHVAPATKDLSISQLPFRAYQRIFNDYYLDTEIDDPTVSEPSVNSDNYPVGHSEEIVLCTLRTRRWEKDYFTTALPYTQLGTEVTLPLGAEATVKLDTDYASINTQKWKDSVGGATVTGNAQFITGEMRSYLSDQTWLDPAGTLYADLASATSATINDLRRSYALQRWLEKNARAGSRYFEQMLSHFGVKNPDSRLQRAEYIGGGKMPVKISEVLQTSASEVNSSQGNMAGHAFASGTNANGYYKCGEHGIIIGLLSVMPRSSYMQGMHKFFSKDDRFDFYWPEFANIGEQALMTNELYLENDEDNEVFGYVPRYQEYRFRHDRVAGYMRDDYDFWHLARNFDSKPSLNSTFIACLPDDRIWPVRGEEYRPLIVQIWNSVKAIRPVVKYGTPI